MRSFLALIGLLSAGFLCVERASAQRRFITIDEYLAGISQAAAKPEERSRHIETTEETLSVGAVIKTVKRVYDYVPPHRSREYAKITQEGRVTESELIKIDYMWYERQNGGPWSAMDTSKDVYGRGYGSGRGTGSSRQCDQFSVDASSLDGKPMRLYEWTSVEGSGNELTFKHVREWIGQDGLRYRQEFVKGKLSPRDETNRSTTTYNYDPNIKIEAPIK